MNIDETLQILTEKFGSIQNEAWFISLKKDAFSKNITAADWNALVYKAAVNSNDTEVLKYTLTNSIEWWKESEAALKSRATDLEDRATKLEGRATTLEGRATNLESRATVLEGRADGLQAHANNLDSDITDGDLAKKLAVYDIVEGNLDYASKNTLDKFIQSVVNGDFSQLVRVCDFGADYTEAPTLIQVVNNTASEISDIQGDIDSVELSLGDISLDIDDINSELRDIRTDLGSALNGEINYTNITQWNLIITDPNDLVNLPDASGTVLVKLVEPYKGTLYATLSDSLKLLDFGGSKFEGVHLIADTGANTIVRNIRRVNNTEHIFENFKLVSNAQGYSKIINCREVENTFITLADTSRHIHNCTATPVSDTAVFGNCTHISDIDIVPLESFPNLKYTIEFYNCHHINNVHCAPNTNHGASDIASNIHYQNCTFVDPYTCAGFVQTENSDKVPVPDVAGYTDFKEFVPIIPNNSAYSQVYSQLPDGKPSRIAASPSSTNKGLIPLRQADGHIKAPDQTIFKPELDQYISRRYFEAHAPSGGGGSKLYRHDFIVYYVKYTNYSDLNLRFSLYTSESEPYTNFNDVLSLVPFLFAASGTYDPTGEAWYKAIVTHFTHREGNLKVFSHGWDGEGLAQFEVSFYTPNDSFVDGDDYMYDFSDTVTEVF